MSKDKGHDMKRFYKVNKDRVIEFGYNNNENIWYVDLIDTNVHMVISTDSARDKTVLIDSIIENDWFNGEIVNYTYFINDVL